MSSRILGIALVLATAIMLHAHPAAVRPGVGGRD